MQRLFLSVLLAGTIAQGWAQSWERMDGPAGGWTYCVNQVGNTMLLGSDKGLYKSTDWGLTWQPDTASGLPYEPIRSICVKGDTIVAGTRKSLYTSYNAGASWTMGEDALGASMGFTPHVVFNGSTFFSNTENMGYTSADGITWQPVTTAVKIGKSGSTLFAAYGIDLKRSLDNGATWSTIHTQPQGYSYIAGNGATLLVSTYPAGILRSSDNGNTFAPANNGLPTTLLMYADAMLYKGDTVYTAVNSYPSQIYMSTNGGLNWNGVNPVNPGFNVPTFGLYQNGKVMLACGAVGLFRSTNMGNTWQYILNKGNNMAKVYGLLEKNDQLFAATDMQSFGMHRSSDKGNTWSIPDSSILYSDCEYIAATNSTIVAFTGTGFIRSTDNGNNWQYILNDDLNTTRHLFSYNNTFFAGTYFHGFWRSDDQGLTWSQVITNGTAVFGHTRKGNDLYIACSGGVVRHSSDGGTTWTNLPGTGLPGFDHVVAIASNDSFLFATTRSGDSSTIYRSADLGNSWQPCSAGLPKGMFNTLTVKGDTLVAGTDLEGEDFENTHLYMSPDNGVTWMNYNQGMYLMTDIKCLKYIDGILHAGTEGGGLWRLSTNTPVGIGERESGPATVTIYPNPAGNTIHIMGAADVHLYLYNVKGQQVLQAKHARSVSIAHLAEGMYFARITDSKGKIIAVQPLVKRSATK